MNSTLKAWTTEVIFLHVLKDFNDRHSHFRKGDVAIWVKVTVSAK